MQNKIIVISGANSGIGKSTATQLAAQGAHIVMVCRSKERGEAAREEIEKSLKNASIDLMLCDLASQESIADFGAAFREKYDRVDVLVNNAGGIFGQRVLSSNGLEYTLALNHMGYFLFTHELLPVLRRAASARIVNVSSLAHKMVRSINWENIQAEKNYNQLYQYGLSKLFNIWFTQELAKMLQSETITANALHPGTVNTGFGSTAGGFFKRLVSLGARFLMTADKGAATSVYLASNPQVAQESGQYFSSSRRASISKLAKNEAAAQKLWQLSLEWGKIEDYGNPIK